MFLLHHVLTSNMAGANGHWAGACSYRYSTSLHFVERAYRFMIAASAGGGDEVVALKRVVGNLRNQRDITSSIRLAAHVITCRDRLDNRIWCGDKERDLLAG